MYPPHHIIAAALKTHMERYAGDETEFRDAFAHWPENRQDEFFNVLQDPKRRPKILEEFSAQHGANPQWIVGLRGSIPDMQFGAGGLARGHDGTRRYAWVETFGVEVITCAPSHSECTAWHWLGICCVQSAQIELQALPGVSAVYHGNAIAAAADIADLMPPELGTHINRWWHVTLDCSVRAKPADQSAINQILVMGEGYFDDDGDEGGLVPQTGE